MGESQDGVAAINDDAIYIGTSLDAEEAYKEIVEFNKDVHQWGRPEDIYVQVEEASYECDRATELEKFFELADAADEDVVFFTCNLNGADHSAWYTKEGNLDFDEEHESRVTISGVNGYENGLVHREYLEGDIANLYDRLQ